MRTISKDEVRRGIKTVSLAGFDGRAVPGGAGLKGPVLHLPASEGYFSAALEGEPPCVVMYSREEVNEFAARGLLTLLPSAERRVFPWIRNGVVIYVDHACVDVLQSAFDWSQPPRFVEDNTARLVWSYERMDEAAALLANWTRRLLQRVRLEITKNTGEEHILAWLTAARYCAHPHQREMRREVLGLSLAVLQQLGRRDAVERLRDDVQRDAFDPEQLAAFGQAAAAGRAPGTVGRMTLAPSWAASGPHPVEASI